MGQIQLIVSSAMMSVRHFDLGWIDVWWGLLCTPAPAYVGSNRAIDTAAGLFPRMQENKYLSVYKILGMSGILYVARMMLCKT